MQYQKWNDTKRRAFQDIRQLEEREASIVGQIALLQEELQKVRERKLSLIAGNEGGDLALRLTEEEQSSETKPPATES
jgi:hypothetical protein